MHMTKFILTKDHIKLLQRMYVGWQDCETGAPEIDPKRPYGNSDVDEDVAEILDIKPTSGDYLSDKQRERMFELHHQTLTALQIVLCTGKFQPGTYVRKDEDDDRGWVLKK